MNTAEYVDNLIVEQKSKGIPLQTIAWNAALACVGWPYVFAARGQYCTPSNRRARYREDHPTIKTACKNYDGNGTCSGCKWYPGGKRVRMFDCRGFTYFVLKSVYNGWELMGAGATSQWDTESNWKAKGTIDSMPKDTLVCLFVKKGSKMEHTGFGLNNETIECSSGVQYFKSRNKKWTHWGVPKVIDGDIPEPDPSAKPTLRKGDKGPYVTLAQTKLINKGYSLPKYGADGDFGNETLAAVKKLQGDYGLKPDGVIGEDTWAVLDSAEPQKLYTVTVPHLSKDAAESLAAQYQGSTVTEEQG